MWLKKYCLRKYCWLRRQILGENASPEFIARGWAIGMFYGCLIPFGVQLLCSIPTAFLLKGSKIGAALGTLLTNHVTIFFIYPAQCWVGNRLMGGSLSYAGIEMALEDVFKEQSFEALQKIGTELLIAFFIGGALLTLIMTPLTYWFVKRMVVMNRARIAARQKKNQK